MPLWVRMMSNWARIGTWLLVGIPVMQRLIEKPELLGRPSNLLWLGAWLTFGLVFYLVSVRQGVKSLLELSQGIEVVAEASDGEEGLAVIAQHRPDVVLLDRELEILRLMASGFNNHEIADSSKLAEGTVKNHVSSILSKLGCATEPERCLRRLIRG
jgi:DNA-binding CsgD family transcriptional regulator